MVEDLAQRAKRDGFRRRNFVFAVALREARETGASETAVKEIGCAPGIHDDVSWL